MKAFCLFEQSGTFKNEFKKLGIDAEDYDIKNDFGQTDHIVDLFGEIRGGYYGRPSLFDEIGEDDIVMAFFPCIRFANQTMVMFRGQQAQMKKWTDVQKMENCMKLQDELTEMYKLVNMLFIICIRKNIKLIMENPFSEEHYLRRYWCMKPAIIDRDRQLRGDYFTKPTQYWFLNFKPKNNFIFEAQVDNAIRVKDAQRLMTKKDLEKCGIVADKRVARSMIHPDYANRFIREFIL